MPRTTTLAVGSALALALGAAGTLLAPTATAAAPFTSSDFDFYRSMSASGCTTTWNTATSPPSVPITVNAPAATVTQQYTATLTNDTTPADVTEISVTNKATGRVTTAGNNPASITLGYSGQAQRTTQTTPSECLPYGYNEIDVYFDFTLTEPMWADIALTSRGGSATRIYLSDDDYDPYADYDTRTMTAGLTGHVLLRPGRYYGYLEGHIRVSRRTDVPTTGSGAASVTFTRVGARVAGPSGTAKPYVAFPTIRNCASHNTTLKLTTDAARAKTMRKVVVSVNGRDVKTIKSGFRGKAVPLTLRDDQSAKVKVAVTTVQVKKQKKITRTSTVAANYLACN